MSALAGAGLVQFGSPILRGQGVKGDRILVCLYDFEGNDSNNVVVPLDGGRYTAYSSARGTLAIDEASLLSAQTTSGAEIGFHPSMPEMRDFFSMRRLAVVANVGSPMAGSAGSFLDRDLNYLPGAFAAPEMGGRIYEYRQASARGKPLPDPQAGLSASGIMHLGFSAKADSNAPQLADC